MSAYLQKYACGVVLVLASISAVSGCSVVNSFKPEVIEIDDGQVTIKGWLDAKKSLFCVKIQLKARAETVTLHSLNLIGADGTKSAPDNWKDQTPRKPTPRVSFGFGFGLGGDRGHHPHGHGGGHDGGGGMIVRPGFSVPLQKEKSTRSVTSVTACWKIGALKSAGVDVSQCDLEVNLARMARDKISLTTLVLAMDYHEDEKKADPPPEADKQTAEDLIREIDFTQKGPVKTKSLDV